MKARLLLIIILLSHLSCKKDEKDDFPPNNNIGEYQKVSEELKSYYYFPEGTYWVYKRIDTNVNIYDTALVVRNSQLIFNDPSIDPFPWEQLTTTIEHTYYESFPIHGFENLVTQFYNSPLSDNVLSLNSLGEVFGPHLNFFSVPVDSLLIYSNGQGSVGASYLYDTSDVQLSFGQVQNVAHIEQKSIYYNDTLVLAKNIGLIKFYHTLDDSSWELIEYKLK